MRIALITIDDADGEDSLILGRSVAQHQLEFAVEAGCDAVIAMGDPHSSNAFRLRHAAEHYGIKFRTVSVTHNLLGAVGSGDELIVFDQNILPSNEAVLARLKRANAIITIAADPAVGLGYERIDAAHAWAGAMRIPGQLVENLSQLPRDCEASAALLRIALQAKVLTHTIAVEALNDGSWQRLGNDDFRPAESRLIDRRLGSVTAGDVTGWSANSLVRSFSATLFRQRAPAKILAAMSVGLAAVGAGAALYSVPVAGFLAVALAAVFARVTTSLDQLQLVDFTKPTFRKRGLAVAVDGALAICGVEALDAGLLQSVFPAVILLALLHVLPTQNSKIYSRLFHDRAVLGVAFAVAAALGYQTPAIMVACLLLLGDAKYRIIKGAA